MNASRTDILEKDRRREPAHVLEVLVEQDQLLMSAQTVPSLVSSLSNTNKVELFIKPWRYHRMEWRPFLAQFLYDLFYSFFFVNDNNLSLKGFSKNAIRASERLHCILILLMTKMNFFAGI